MAEMLWWLNFKSQMVDGLARFITSKRTLEVLTEVLHVRRSPSDTGGRS